MKQHDKVLQLPVKSILKGDNPREQLDQVSLSELMANMKHNGLMSPVGVRQLPKGQWKLVFGHRRLIAAERLGWETIDALELDVADETDAMLKTSSENVIRENVSLPENGRLFSALLKKGLTSEQISVRMGCSKRFVLNALAAFQDIPKEYHDRITFGTRGAQPKDGQIPATVALAAVDLTKSVGMPKENVGKLMEWAAKNSANTTQMRTAGRMIGDGMPVKEALKKVEYMKNVTITVTMKIATIQRLQNKAGMTIHDILYKYLEQCAEFGLIPVRLDRMSEKNLPEELVRKRKVPRRNR